MNTYIKVDQNGDLTQDLRIYPLIEAAIQSGANPAEFDENTYQLPAGALFAPITIIQPPIESLTKYQRVIRAPIAKNQAGEWVLDNIIEEVDQNSKNQIDGIITSEARRIRNTLLTQSDWTQLPDAQISAEKKTEWTTYRQALRDITQHPGFPIYHVFPAIPQ